MKKVQLDREPLSNIHHFEDLKKSFAWQDVVAELEIWIEQIRDLMEETDSKDEWNKCKGRLEILRRIPEMPNVFIEALEQAKEGKEMD